MDDPSTQNVTEGFGLMFYNARWYDPTLGRFAQADSLVPAGVQGYDRYAYVNNNPLSFTDPSGHVACTDDGYCGYGDYLASLDQQAEDYGATFTHTGEKDWTARNKTIALQAIQDVGTALLRDYCSLLARMGDGCDSYSAVDIFRNVYGTSANDPLILQWGCSECNGGGGYTYSTHKIGFASLSEPTMGMGGYRTSAMASTEAINNVVHELGHAFAGRWNLPGGGYNNFGPYGTGRIPGNLVSDAGFYLYPKPYGASLTWRQHPCSWDSPCSSHEVFADMFLGWTYGDWDDDRAGRDRRVFMSQNMGAWIVNLVSP